MPRYYVFNFHGNQFSRIAILDISREMPIFRFRGINFRKLIPAKINSNNVIRYNKLCNISPSHTIKNVTIYKICTCNRNFEDRI